MPNPPPRKANPLPQHNTKMRSHAEAVGTIKKIITKPRFHRDVPGRNFNPPLRMRSVSRPVARSSASATPR
jgi:hypothetical protein